jgi:hypothetical protein
MTHDNRHSSLPQQEGDAAAIRSNTTISSRKNPLIGGSKLDPPSSSPLIIHYIGYVILYIPSLLPSRKNQEQCPSQGRTSNGEEDRRRESDWEHGCEKSEGGSERKTQALDLGGGKREEEQ